MLTPLGTRRADINGDGVVNGFDLGLLLGAWTGSKERGARVAAPWDLDRRSRVAACKVDIGAYELGDCIGDLTGDGQVSGADLALVLGNWLGTGQGDLTCDNIVDGADIAVILGNWGDCPSCPAPKNMMMGSMMFDSGGSIAPETLAALFGFESVEEFAAWLDTLEFETMSSILSLLNGE